MIWNKIFLNIFFQLKIGRKWKEDFEYDFPVSVIKNLDLNISNPSLRLPFKIEDKKYFETSTMFIGMSVQTARTGYVSGQRANFLVRINNQSGVYIRTVQVGLFQIIHYNSDNPKKKKISINIIKSYDNADVPQFSSKEIKGHVNIPVLDPSTEGSCKVIEIFYEVHVKAKIDGLVSSPSVKIPIVIGTVPYVEMNELIQSVAEPHPSTSRAPLPTFVVSKPPEICDLR